MRSFSASLGELGGSILLPLVAMSLLLPRSALFCYNEAAPSQSNVSMPEIWLRPNRRALWLGMILPLVVTMLGAGGAAYAFASGLAPGWWIAGAVIAALGIFLIASLAYSTSLPRLAYESGELLVFLAGRNPVRVPIEVVEVFFVGQGASNLPKLLGREPETANVIVRLAESTPEWKHRDVDPRFAHWCEGYITLRGAWCEPINNEALRRLNKRLVEVQRERKGEGERAR